MRRDGSDEDGGECQRTAPKGAGVGDHRLAEKTARARVAMTGFEVKQESNGVVW